MAFLVFTNFFIIDLNWSGPFYYRIESPDSNYTYIPIQIIEHPSTGYVCLWYVSNPLYGYYEGYYIGITRDLLLWQNLIPVKDLINCSTEEDLITVSLEKLEDDTFILFAAKARYNITFQRNDIFFSTTNSSDCISWHEASQVKGYDEIGIAGMKIVRDNVSLKVLTGIENLTNDVWTNNLTVWKYNISELTLTRESDYYVEGIVSIGSMISYNNRLLIPSRNGDKNELLIYNNGSWIQLDFISDANNLENLIIWENMLFVIHEPDYWKSNLIYLSQIELSNDTAIQLFNSKIVASRQYSVDFIAPIQSGTTRAFLLTTIYPEPQEQTFFLQSFNWNILLAGMATFTILTGIVIIIVLYPPNKTRLKRIKQLLERKTM
ncbi:MAG: hypothetical protein ACXADA_05230 [Candidatus Hodarchaeales archaeon]